ncbi:putative transmembrane protein [Microdochium trichocladiopsis]|uniref:Transmembrane protein n=1 Tax=Microdochium trichocladiopsis TaxID=1682393 RepID=A0A9P8XZF4_9PEZI|nr:putative transmembrane protein [Microdochium trichocladiopsis]KAH7024478.1 putative transmembrane protein [Microdochium trichocladiopsis]
MDHSRLHHFIIASFLNDQRPPMVSEIAAHFQTDTTAAREALRALADYHGVVLHPHSDEIWVAHPFSAAPTTCVVSSAGRKWWGNCAWCSLGVMHLARGTSSTFTTRTGAIGDEVTLSVEDGQLRETDFVVHFPVPMRNVWDNVIYICSVQLLFRDEAEVEEWCATRGIPKGDVRPVQQVWDFAREWYGRHADADWTKWSLHEAVEIFRKHGLTGPTWTIGDESGRF